MANGVTIDYGALDDTVDDPTTFDDRGGNTEPEFQPTGMGDDPTTAGVVDDGNKKTNVAIEGPTSPNTAPSPGDLIAQAEGGGNIGQAPSPNPGQPGFGNLLPGEQVANSISSANGKQGPQSAEQMAFQNANPNGGSFSNPNPGSGLSIEQQSAQTAMPNGGTISSGGNINTPPSLPLGAGPGTTPSPSGTGTGSSNFITSLLDQKPTGPNLPGAGGEVKLSPQERLVKDASGNVVGVRSENGYYDPNFQSSRNMLDNYQRGDRMAGTIDGLHILANAGDKNAAAVLGADQRNGSNFMSSGLEADWAKAHIAQIAGALPGLGNNKAAAANLAGQEVAVNQNPLSNADAFPMAAKMETLLGSLKDVLPGSVKFDNYGNVIFQDAGGVRHIPANQWADWLPVIEQRVAAQNGAGNPNTASNPHGGANSPRGGANSPRGNGGSTPNAPFDAAGHLTAAQQHVGNALNDRGNVSESPSDTGSWTPPEQPYSGPPPQNLGTTEADFTGPQNQPGGNGNFGSQNLGSVQANFTQGASIPEWIAEARRKGLIP